MARAWVPLMLGAVAATVLVGAGLRLLALRALGAGPTWSQQLVPDLGLLILPAIGLGALFLLIRVAHQCWRRAGLAAGLAVLLLVLGGWGLTVHSAATAASGCPDLIAPATPLTRYALTPLDLPMFCQRLSYQPALPACPCRPTVPVVLLTGDQHPSLGLRPEHRAGHRRQPGRRRRPRTPDHGLRLGVMTRRRARAPFIGPDPPRRVQQEPDNVTAAHGEHTRTSGGPQVGTRSNVDHWPL